MILELEKRLEKKKKGQSELEMERAKLLQARELAEEKMEQNDEHQKLRASISLAKVVFSK